MAAPGTESIRVATYATDPIAEAGVAQLVDALPGLSVSDSAPPVDCDVVVAVAARVTPEVLTTLRSWLSDGGPPVVLLTDDRLDDDPLTVVSCRVVAVLPRRSLTPERLHGAVAVAASGGAVLPPELLGTLVRQVERLQREVLAPRGLTGSGLSAREVDVLRLLADGWDTADIAERLDCSERTVTNTVYALTTRLRLRNRAHAVAYALRAGII